MRTGSVLAPPVQVAELDSAADEWMPRLSVDRLTVYFASNRTAAAAKGGFDIWTAHRNSVDDGFPAPTIVDELNSSTGDFPIWLAADNCRLYSASQNADSNQLFMATRQR